MYSHCLAIGQVQNLSGAGISTTFCLRLDPFPTPNVSVTFYSSSLSSLSSFSFLSMAVVSSFVCSPVLPVPSAVFWTGSARFLADFFLFVLFFFFLGSSAVYWRLSQKQLTNEKIFLSFHVLSPLNTNCRRLSKPDVFLWTIERRVTLASQQYI